MNESMPCHHMYGGDYGQGPGPGENIPAWLMFDQHHGDYIFAGLQPGQRIPQNGWNPASSFQGDTLDELAAEAGLPVER